MSRVASERGDDGGMRNRARRRKPGCSSRPGECRVRGK